MDVGPASSNVENVAPNVLRRVLTELSKLIKSPPEGISICEDGQNLTDIEAVVEGPVGTPYAGGKFHVRVVLGKDFPAAPPKCFFTTKIFHPNVSSDGSVCVNTLKRDWEASLGIQHILLTIKCLLIVPNPESALNEEAGKMLLEHYDDYWQRARMMTEIHAQPAKAALDGPSAKKHAGDKKVLQERKKTLKDKKRTLKRL